MSRLNLLLIPALLISLSCDEDPSETANADDDETGATDSGGEKATPAWADADFDQKKKHMAEVVLPTMSAVFQGVDAERYADFSCASCHGPGAMDDQFAMPSPSLPKLSPNGDFSAEMERAPETVAFMMNSVVPQMAATLGVEPFSPENQQGLGCYACHQTNE